MMKNEMIYTIPLRTNFVKVPKHRRAKRAINTIKEYVEKHMKTENVKLGKELNESVWENGIKNPPGKVTVKAIRHDDYVSVELEGFEYKVEKVQTTKEEPKTLKDKLEAKMGDKPGNQKAEPEKSKTKSEEKPSEKKTESKEIKKEESKDSEKKPSVKSKETESKEEESDKKNSSN